MNKVSKVEYENDSVAVTFSHGEGEDNRPVTVRLSFNNGYINTHFSGLRDDRLQIASNYANGFNIHFGDRDVLRKAETMTYEQLNAEVDKPENSNYRDDLYNVLARRFPDEQDDEELMK